MNIVSYSCAQYIRMKSPDVSPAMPTNDDATFPRGLAQTDKILNADLIDRADCPDENKSNLTADPPLKSRNHGRAESLTGEPVLVRHCSLVPPGFRADRAAGDRVRSSSFSTAHSSSPTRPRWESSSVRMESSCVRINSSSVVLFRDVFGITPG